MTIALWKRDVQFFHFSAVMRLRHLYTAPDSLKDDHSFRLYSSQRRNLGMSLKDVLLAHQGDAFLSRNRVQIQPP